MIPSMFQRLNMNIQFIDLETIQATGDEVVIILSLKLFKSFIYEII